MKAFDKIRQITAEVVAISNNGAIYHLKTDDGLVYRRFSDEITVLIEG